MSKSFAAYPYCRMPKENTFDLVGEKLMPQNFYELVWIFIIYAFLGWCTEVSYAALDTGKFVNRGFLNGPYCPVYGCGVVIVVAALTPLKENLLILFVGSFFLTSVLEYITGFILEKAFHNKWWDYSDKPFNIHGYVCLKFSIYWGLACTFIMDVLHPIIYGFITKIPFVLGVVILVIIMSGFAVDLCVTVSTILKFNKRLKLLDELAGKIHDLSDDIGENIYENVTNVVEKSEEFQENHEELLTKLSEKKENILEFPNAAKDKLAETTDAAKSKLVETTDTAKNKLAETKDAAKLAITENILEAKSEYEAKKLAFEEKTNAAKDEREAARMAKQQEREELNRKYKELLEQKNFGFKRLMKAFPDMTSRDQNESLQKYKQFFNIKKSSDEKKMK